MDQTLAKEMNNLEPDLVDQIELKSDVLVAACMSQVEN